MGFREGDTIKVEGRVRTSFTNSQGKPALEVEVHGHYFFVPESAVTLTGHLIQIGDTVQDRTWPEQAIGKQWQWTVLAIEGDMLWCKPIGHAVPDVPVNKYRGDVWRVDPTTEPTAVVIDPEIGF